MRVFEPVHRDWVLLFRGEYSQEEQVGSASLADRSCAEV